MPILTLFIVGFIYEDADLSGYSSILFGADFNDGEDEDKIIFISF